ncbi:uncharacterized protein LOC119587352 [Penaeus monodon]|uniref:uncharacterized protein LOC119587352 n=1 Tax=Penaeus monodon TaxID=6687 RepID=UPI0018A775A9|nr:uncharacterized protein LOC119587352 [Penaeus monodon]
MCNVQQEEEFTIYFTMAEALMGSDDSIYEAQQFTEEEIEEAFQSDFLTKEFWSDEDNLDMLQAILDFKFNASPGSEFEADVMYCRNSRLLVYCLSMSFKDLVCQLLFHAMEYLATKFQKNVSLANLSAERSRVYECEGGVNFSILDFSSHLPAEMQESQESDSKLSTLRVSRLFSLKSLVIRFTDIELAFVYRILIVRYVIKCSFDLLIFCIHHGILYLFIPLFMTKC